MRVALVTHTAQLGGAELSSLRLLQALPAGMTIDAVVGEEGPFADHLRDEGITVHVLPMDPSATAVARSETRSPRVVLGSAVRLAPAVRDLTALLRSLGTDVLWSLSLKAHLFTVPVARLTGIPLVWHLHDRISREYLPAPTVRAIRALARHVPTAVIANSAATAATVGRARGLTVARPGLTDSQLEPSANGVRSTNVIGVLGRLSPTKGQLDVVRLLPDLLAVHPDLKLRLIGAPLFGQQDYQDRIVAEIARLGLCEHVEIVGHVDDPRAELDRLAVCVHASTIPEPFGQVISEAMARGTPVVATRGGGATELVHPPGARQLGHLVPIGDSAAMREAILDVLDAPERAASRAVRARLHVGEHLRIEATAAVVAEVFRSVVDPQRSVAAPEVALAHDYLTQRGGAERVVLAMHAAFPESPLHTMLYEPAGSFPELEHLRVVAGPLSRVSALRHRHRAAFPLLPFASSLTRVSGEVTVASTSGWAHAFRTSGATVVYCHSPARWLYQTDAYLGGPAHRSPVGLGVLAMRPLLRRWDRRHMRTADRVLVNSTAVQHAVRTAYGIEAELLHPPPGLSVDGPRAAMPQAPDEFYLVVSRLLPYKNVDVIVEAFRGLPEHLVIVGSGPMLDQMAADLPANVTLVSDQSDAQLRWAYERARALVVASHEDFGLTPVEAASFGTPALALRAGGYLDTVIEGANGEFFDTPTPEAIRTAVVANRGRAWDTERIMATVDRFAHDRFAARLREVVAEVRAERSDRGGSSGA